MEWAKVSHCQLDALPVWMVVHISILRCKEASAGTAKVAKLGVLNYNLICLWEGVLTSVANSNIANFKANLEWILTLRLTRWHLRHRCWRGRHHIRAGPWRRGCAWGNHYSHLQFPIYGILVLSANHTAKGRTVHSGLCHFAKGLYLMKLYIYLRLLHI